MGDHAELAPVKIIGSFKERFFMLYQDKLQKILNLQNGSKFDPNKVVILSVVGERNSGKSFLLNILLQYLRSGGDGNWMNPLVKNKSAMRGFFWNDLEDTIGIYKENSNHSIYMWPQPLPLEDSSGNKVWVLIMDAVKAEESSSDYGPLEELISLLSSNLIDAHREVFKPTLLNALESVSTFQPSDYDYNLKDKPKLSPCSNITFVVTDCQDSCGWGEKAIKYIDQKIGEAVTSESLKLIYKNLQERSACLFKKAEKTPLADKFGVLDLDTALTRQIKTFSSKLLGDGLSLKDFKEIDILQYFKHSVDTVNALIRHRSMISEPPRMELMPGSGENEELSNSAQDIEIDMGNEDVEMLDLSGEPGERDQNCACDINAFNPPNICVKSVVIVKEFGPHSPSHRLSLIYPQLPPIVNEYQSERELPKSPVCLQRSKVDSSSFKDESTIGQKTFASSTPTPTEQGNNESACSSSSNFKADNPSSFVSQDVRNLQYVDQKSSQNTGQTSSNGNLTSPGKCVNTFDFDKLLQDTVQSIISSNSKADNHSSSSYFPSQDSNVQKQNSGDFSNVNIHPSELDDIIQETVQWMKNDYKARMDKVPILQQQRMHYEAKDVVCKNFRKFLNEIQLDSKMKGEHVQMLEKHLEMEHKKMQANNKKHNQEEETAQRNVESTRNKEAKTSSYSTNVDDQTDDRNKETHVSNNPEAAKVCIGNILEDYDQEMHNKLNLDKALEISDKRLDQAHEKVVKKLLEKLPGLLDMKHVEESGREEVKKTLDVKLELHKNEIKNNFTKIQKGLDELGKELQRELEKGMNEWVSQSINLDQISKKSTTVLYNDCLRKVLQRAEIYRDSNSKQNALESLFKQQTNELLILCNNLDESLEHYRFGIAKKIQMFTCLNREKFAEFHDTIAKESEKKLKQHPFVKKLLQTGLTKYKSQFSQRNQKIQQHEKEIAKSLIPQTINFYHMQMKALVLDQNRLFGESELDKLHTRLVEECFVAFKAACNFHPYSDLPEMKEELTNELHKLLKGYSDKNLLRVQKSSGHILKAIDEQKKAYSTQMDKLLPRRGPSVNPMELVKFHEKAKVECCKILEKEIIGLKLNLAIAEPIKTLNEKIQEEWNEFQKLNEQKVEKEMFEKRELEKEKVRADAEREAREQEMAENSRKSNKANQTAEWKTAMPATVAPQVPQRSNDVPSEEVKDLPPIAIQFGPKCVRLGWISDGDFESITNIWGDEDIPFRVALTKDQKILIGTEMENQRNSIASEFNLEDVFYEPNQNKEYECEIKNTGCTEVSKEMLFAIFLSRIKGDTENILRGQWTTAVITVPLWYSSVQRQCTKDAAEIAGFSNVSLVNETSAAALAFVNEPTRRDNYNGNYVLVGVQCDRHFDAAVYKYSRGKIEMISSCGDLHCSESSNPGLFQYFKNILKNNVNKVTSYFFGTSEVEPEMKMLDAIAKPNKTDITENLLISTSGGEIHKGMENFFKKYGRQHTCQKKTILLGAAYFGELLKRGDNVTKEYIKDRATYKFIRRGGYYNTRYSKDAVLFYKEYQFLNNSNVRYETTVGVSTSKFFSIIIEEESRSIFEVGTILIPGSQLPYQVKDVRLSVLLNSEGVFRVDHVYYSGDKKQKVTMDYEWKSPNLTGPRKKTYMQVAKSLQKDEKKEALEKSSNDLQILINQIEPQLQSVRTVFGKKILETRISEAKAQVTDSKRSQERIDSLIETLTGLRSKFLSDT